MTKVKIHFLNLIFCLVILLGESIIYGYDESLAHPEIALRAIKYSQLDVYLKSSLKFVSGIDTVYKTSLGQQTVRTLLQQGSTNEDSPLCRATNHFHNPMKPWDRAGITSIYSPLCPTWDITNYSTRYSTLTWATGYDSPDGPVVSRSKQNMGWDNARAYYNAALTSEAKTEQEDYFSKTFQAVGQVIHLLQDMAVPAHVRNDFWNSHVWTGGANPYELYVKKNNNLITNLTKDKITGVVPSFTASTVSDFWDTTYYQSPPILDPDFQKKAGLAEYTNANFVSEGTLFSNSAATENVYPQKSSTDQVIHDISDPFVPGATVKRHYYYKTKDWEARYHLAGVNYTYFYMPESGTPSPDIMIPPMDRYVHEDYAEKLLPRAVGYSAALIDYFFRGQLGVSFASNGIKVKNLSKEDMTYYHDPVTGNDIGSIEVYYDDTENVRHLLKSYSLATGQISVLAPGQETPIVEFETPNDNIKKHRYIIAFKGRLGNEDGAVVGRVYVPTVYYLSTVDEIDRIARVDVDGSNRSIVADTQLANIYLGRFSLSPDGNALVFMNMEYTDGYNASILHLDLTTGLHTYLTSGNNPAWSPDGTKIAFSRELGRVSPFADEQLFTLDLATGIETQLTDASNASSVEPAWSPDGGKIAYARFNQLETDCVNDYTINIMTASGAMDAPVTCATDNVYIDREPTWSPDGKEIAFVRKVVGGESNLYKATLSTIPAIAALLSDASVAANDDHSPAWSPDGSVIAVSSKFGEYSDVRLVDAHTGASLLNLTETNPGNDGLPIFGK